MNKVQLFWLEVHSISNQNSLTMLSATIPTNLRTNAASVRASRQTCADVSFCYETIGNYGCGNI
jgi:hypothetical protein